MPTIVDVGPMVELLEAEWDALDRTCSGLNEEQWKRPTCLPGWSVQDQLAHVVGIERMLLGEQAPEVDVSHLGHIRNDIGRIAEVWVEELRPWPGAEVLERFRSVTEARVAALRCMTQTDFDAPSWTPVGKDETYGRFMRIRHYDCFLHGNDIREALGVPLRDDATAVSSAWLEVEPSLGYIVGRKASFPDGASLRLVVTGSTEQVRDIQVADGRAAVVGSVDTPTVTMTLPAWLLLRLTGGRTAAEPFVGAELLLEGDDELGRRLVSSLAVTI